MSDTEPDTEPDTGVNPEDGTDEDEPADTPDAPRRQVRIEP